MLHHQADRIFEVGVGRVPLLERAPPECPLALRSAAERQHYRQRDLALAKIVAGVLAELGRLAAVIEGVIHELKGDTEIHPERAAGVLLVFGPRGERRTHLAGGGEELCGLGANDGEVVVLGSGGVLGGAELHHLAFGDDRGGGGENFKRSERGDFDHHLERLAEQEIADQYARLVAPQHARRELAAPHLALVDDVVVQQGCRVHELHRRRELDVAVPRIMGELRHRHGQHRPQPLAAGADQMIGDLGNHRHLGAGPRQDRRIDAVHVGGHELA